MKKGKKILCTLLAVLLVVGCLPLAASAETWGMATAQENKEQVFSISPTIAESKKKKVLQAVNEERKKVGASTLGRNTLLSKAADIRAKEIAKSFSHTRPDGTECFSVLKEVGIKTYTTCGENIAYNFGYSKSEEQVMKDWMNSPGHKANILNSKFQLIGIGLYVEKDTYYWTQVFYAGSAIKAEPEKENTLPQKFVGWSAVWVEDVTKDNAVLCGDLNNFSGTQMAADYVGARLWKGNTLLKEETVEKGKGFPGISNVDGTDDVLIACEYDIQQRWGITLDPGTTYTYQMFAKYNKSSKEYISDKMTFTTEKGQAEPYPGTSFIDVPRNAYYGEAVKWAVDNSITSGIDNTHFGPNTACTRAQAVTFLWRAAGSPEPQNADAGFTDVKAGDYYEKAVRWAVENGVTSGTGDGKFSPSAKCTRAQIVTFQYRAAGSPSVGAAGSFGDVNSGAYYAEAVAWAVQNNITSGTGGGNFSPSNKCTRAQIVTFLYRDAQ